MSKDGGAAFQVWECKIVVPHDVILPQGFDHPPRFAAMSAVEKAGVPIVACFSGWNGKLSIHQIRAMKYKAKLLLAEDAEMALRTFRCAKCKELANKRNEKEISMIKDEEAALLVDLLEFAWGIIANAHGGNWERATDEWQQAAEKWRDKYHAMLAENAAREAKNDIS